MDYNEVFSGLGSSFKVVKNAAYGEVSGYPVIVRGNGSKKAFTVYITTAEAVKGKLLKAVSQKAKEDKVRLSAERRAVLFKVNLKNGEGMEKVMASVNVATTALRENGINPPRNCAVCSRGGADAYVHRVEGVVIYDAVHRECMHKMQTEAAVTAEENPGSYAMGALGAFLGAIVGMIPAFVGLYVFDVLSALLFAVIPIATYYGYKKLKGKMDKAAPAFAVLFSLIGMGLLLLVLDVCINLEYGAGIGDAIYTTVQYTFVKFSADYWTWIRPFLFKVLLCYILGLFCSVGIIGKTNKTKVTMLSSTMETLRPIGNAEAENYALYTDSFSE